MSDDNKNKLMDEGMDTKKAENQEVQNGKISVGDRVKASLSNRKFRSGAYATIVSVIVIVIVLVANIFLSRFDLSMDLTTNNLFTLSKVTKDYVKTIEDDITIYYLVEAGNEDSSFVKLAEQYAHLSDHIKLEYKDPVLYPKFAKKYTEEEVSENSVIVVNNTQKRYKYVDNSDLKESQFNYYTGGYQTTGIDFEGEVTAALQYVTTDDLPVFYEVTGHDETKSGAVLQELLTKQNVELKTLEIVKEDKIPEECQALLINVPLTDYSKAEVDMIKEYLQNGGRAIIFTSFNISDCPNFESLLNYYGVEVVDGYVIEGDSSHMVTRNPMNSLLDIDTSAAMLEDYTDPKGYYVASANVGLKISDALRKTLSVQSFLKTSDAAYSKLNYEAETVSKEEGDIQGPFDIGIAIEEDYNNVKTNLVVIGSRFFAADEILQDNTYANYALIAHIVSCVSNHKSISIDSKSIEPVRLTLTTAEQSTWLYVIVIMIPVVILVIGAVVVVLRRKK